MTAISLPFSQYHVQRWSLCVVLYPSVMPSAHMYVLGRLVWAAGIAWLYDLVNVQRSYEIYLDRKSVV